MNQSNTARGSDGPSRAPSWSPTKTGLVSCGGASNTSTATAACLPSEDADSASCLDNSAIDDESSSLELNMHQQMQLEKELYPGASTWAEPEERLFEVLFLRQSAPLLPSHWDFDFRGVPIVDSVFCTTEQTQPVVYAHSPDEFRATTTLMRLVDLTANARTMVQSGMRHKVPRLIKNGLDSLILWSAKDGGYDNLKVVPNIMTEVIDTKSMSEDRITDYMQYRMQALARLQREFLRVDRHPRFWEDVEPVIMDPEHTLYTLLLEKAKLLHMKLTTIEGADSILDEPTSDISSILGVNLERATKRRRFAPRPRSEEDGLAEGHDKMKRKRGGREQRKLDRIALSELLCAPKVEEAPGSFREASPFSRAVAAKSGTLDRTTTSLFRTGCPNESSGPTFARTPPVVYGLFILNTSVFLLTVDSATVDGAHVSFHVDMDFSDSHQSVWNALTVAIAVCMARDELMGRTEDFEATPRLLECDVDA